MEQQSDSAEAAGFVQALDSWLDGMANCPLPGAVSAAAVAAAMGAALVAKVTRLAMQQQALEAPGLNTVLELAAAQRRELLRLAAADVQAFRSVLDTQARPATDPVRQRAWQEASEVPVGVAEACAALERPLPGLEKSCPPAVRAELKTGAWLLEAGRKAGLLAAEANLRLWGENAGAAPLRLRLDALKEKESC